MNNSVNNNPDFTIEKCKLAMNYLINFFKQLENASTTASDQMKVSSEPENHNTPSPNGNGLYSNSNPFQITIPLGEYEVVIEKLEKKISQKNKEYIQWYLEILNTDEKGKKITKINMIDNEKYISWLLSDLNRFGVNPGDFRQSPCGLIYPELTGKKAIIEVKENKTNGNPYVILKKAIT